MGKTAQVRIRKRGKTYTYLFEAGKKPDGKRNTISKGGFDTAAEAYEAGTKAYTDWKHGGIGITNEKITLSEYLDVWMNKVQDGLAANSVKSYTYNIKHIKQLLGQLMLTDIKPRHIDGFYHALKDKGFSKAYMKSIKSVLCQVLKDAVYPAELIPYNPASDIKLPKAPDKVIKRNITRPESFEKIIETYPMGHTMHMVFVISYHTGLRISEICGLTWDDIDFDKHTLRVTHQLIYEPKIGHFYTPVLKTEGSYRTIYIDNILYNKLLDWKTIQSQNMSELGKGYILSYSDNTGLIWNISGNLPQDGKHLVHFICTNKRGMPVTAGKATPYFAKFGTNSHSFRHTHATLLSEQKVPAKEIALRLGHKKISTTMNDYTDETEIMLQNTKNSFEEIMSHTSD